MTPTNRLLRRIHLYLGLALLPWFIVYAVSSAIFNHGEYFRELTDDGQPPWVTRFERDYEMDIPEDEDAKRQLAARVIEDLGLDRDRAYGTWQPGPDQLVIHTHTFWEATNVRYRAAEGRIEVEDKRFSWKDFLVGLHARGGFRQELVLVDLWGVLVDLVCLGLVAWVITGIYMWWLLSATRRWGAIALGAGILSFIVLVLGW